MDFAHYIALGDSMSMDLFPALDTGATDVAVALERLPSAGAVAPIGAASLLFKNDEAHWPDELGNDLSTDHSGIDFQQYATAGATMGDVYSDQLLALETSDDPTLITLTIGGEDLFSAFSAKPKTPILNRIVADLDQAFRVLVDGITRVRPRSLLVLTTLCDPSDRTGQIPGVLEDIGKLPLYALDQFNAGIRAVASGTPNVVVADAYGEFLGHGASVPEEDRWYWRRAPLEPNAQGANQLRRIWLDAVRRAR
jgi:lysophospholipase L1-like esterase